MELIIFDHKTISSILFCDAKIVFFGDMSKKRPKKTVILRPKNLNNGN